MLLIRDFAALISLAAFLIASTYWADAFIKLA